MELVKAIPYGIFLAIEFIAFLCNLLCTMYDAEYENNVFRYAFNTQIDLWINYEEDLNTVGIIILLTVVTVFLLPSNLALMLIKIVEYICKGVWRFFLTAFKKRG